MSTATLAEKPFAHIPGVVYPRQADAVAKAEAARPRTRPLNATGIARLRKLCTGVQIELGVIAGAIETCEEVLRLPTTKEGDRRAIAETAAEARDAAFQLETTARELWTLFNQQAEEGGA